MTSLTSSCYKNAPYHNYAINYFPRVVSLDSYHLGMPPPGKIPVRLELLCGWIFFSGQL